MISRHLMNFRSPARSFIVSAIKSCAAQKSLPLGKLVHAYVIEHGFLPDTQVYNHLMNMYFKSLDFISGRKLFDEMSERNLVSFSVLTYGLSQSDTPQSTLSLVPQLHKQGLTMNRFVLSNLILACSRLKWVNVGKQTHSCVIVSDFDQDTFVRTSLIDMYSKFGDLDSAVFVFSLSPFRDSVMCNLMLSCYVSFCSYEEALKLFAEAWKDGDLKPSEFTFGSMFKACSNLSRTSGEQIHGFSIKTGSDSDIFVGTSLIDMYGKFGDVESSKEVFENVKFTDIALYNSMIVGFCNNYFYKSAIKLFNQLSVEGFYPNERTFSSISKACGGLKFLSLGKTAHGLVVKSEFSGDLVAVTALIDMYLKCECAKEGYKLFNRLATRSTISYNAMISGLGQCMFYEQSLELYISMNREGVRPDLATFVSLMNSSVGHGKAVYVHTIKHGFDHDLKVQNVFLDSLVKGRFVDDARWLFNSMKERDVVCWTSIISGLSELKLEHEAIGLFKKMIASGATPNCFTFSSVLKACGSLADLDEGRCVQAKTIKHGITDEAFISSSLLDMYARCGFLGECHKLFDEMAKSNLVLWNTMITACFHHGKGHEALELFQAMEDYGVEPNHVTFTSLLSACSHRGLVEEGIVVFDSMTRKHNMLPSMEHYSCMVDLFGRARMLERAKLLIESMPYKPDASIWRTFLASCKLDDHLGLAQSACDHILDLKGGGDNTSLVLLSNIYSELGKWSDVEKVRRRMRDQGKKDPGLSWMQIKSG